MCNERCSKNPAFPVRSNQARVIRLIEQKFDEKSPDTESVRITPETIATQLKIDKKSVICYMKYLQDYLDGKSVSVEKKGSRGIIGYTISKKQECAA